MSATVENYALADGTRMYSVRWRDAAHKSHRKRGFKTKRDAKDYAARVSTALTDGTYTDPSARHITIGFLGRRWIENNSPIWKTKYADTIKSAWRNHVEPVWANREIGSVVRSEIQAWVSRQHQDGFSVTVINRNFGILNGIYEDAIEDGIIAKNPCRGVNKPKRTESGRVYLTVEQLLRLADAAGEYRSVILTLGFCGLRWGELAGLTVRQVDFNRKRLKIDRTWERSGGKSYADVPKSWETREVPMPDIVADALREQCAGKSSDDLVFTNKNGSHISEQKRTNPRCWYARALKASGVPSLTCHDLRHTAASIAVSAGANVKVLQRMLGHKSAEMTLNRYAGLFDSDLDSVADNVNLLVAATVNRDTASRGHNADTIQ